MRPNISDLPDIDKLKMAIECVGRNVPMPVAIQDFLIEHSLYELITNPKVRYVSNKQGDPSSK